MVVSLLVKVVEVIVVKMEIKSIDIFYSDRVISTQWRCSKSRTKSIYQAIFSQDKLSESKL